MKSYEQKYKEALEWMQGMYGGLHGKTKEEAEKYFPELRESEDEKIRKALIENFKWFCGDFPKTTKWGKDDNLLVKDIITWLEKQGQPKWSDEDEEELEIAIKTLHEVGQHSSAIWLKSLKQRIEKQQ